MTGGENRLIDRARKARDSGVVLKARLSHIRASDPTTRIVVFEGQDDLGVYAAWFARLSNSFRYIPMDGRGKGQVLELRTLLRRDETGLQRRVFFVVDRDFDYLQGQSPGDDIYCTDSYSIENYLATPAVLERVLIEELRFPALGPDLAKATALYGRVLMSFAEIMIPINRRLCRARLSQIQLSPAIENRINRYVRIGLGEVTPERFRILELVPLAREPTQEECLSADAEFAKLDPLRRHRGKFLLALFLRWVDILVAELGSGSSEFGAGKSERFSSQKLSLTALAARSALPLGLDRFVAQAEADVA